MMLLDTMAFGFDFESFGPTDLSTIWEESSERSTTKEDEEFYLPQRLQSQQSDEFTFKTYISEIFSSDEFTFETYISETLSSSSSTSSVMGSCCKSPGDHPQSLTEEGSTSLVGKEITFKTSCLTPQDQKREGSCHQANTRTCNGNCNNGNHIELIQGMIEQIEEHVKEIRKKLEHMQHCQGTNEPRRLCQVTKINKNHPNLTSCREKKYKALNRLQKANAKWNKVCPPSA